MFWVHSMELLCDVGQEEAHFCLFGDCVNLVARYVLGLRRMYHRLVNHFAHSMVLLRDMAQVEACFGPFGDSVNLNAIKVHGLWRCSLGSQIILGMPHRTPRRCGSSGSSFQSLWRSVHLSAS
jgi:hypothetical protein